MIMPLHLSSLINTRFAKRSKIVLDLGRWRA